MEAQDWGSVEGVAGATKHVLDLVTGEIVGADIVEFNPRFDVNGVTAIAAAKFVRELASRATANRKGMS